MYPTGKPANSSVSQFSSFHQRNKNSKAAFACFYFPVGSLILVKECPRFFFFLLVVLKYYKYQQQLKRNQEIQEKRALLGSYKLSCVVLTKSQSSAFCSERTNSFLVWGDLGRCWLWDGLILALFHQLWLCAVFLELQSTVLQRASRMEVQVFTSLSNLILFCN